MVFAGNGGGGLKRKAAARSGAERQRTGAKTPLQQCCVNSNGVPIERTEPGHFLRRSYVRDFTERVFWGGDCVWEGGAVNWAVCFDLFGVPVYIDINERVSFERCSDSLSRRLIQFVTSERSENHEVFRRRDLELQRPGKRFDAIDAAVARGKFKRLAPGGEIVWGWLFDE